MKSLTNKQEPKYADSRMGAWVTVFFLFFISGLAALSVFSEPVPELDPAAALEELREIETEAGDLKRQRKILFDLIRQYNEGTLKET